MSADRVNQPAPNALLTGVLPGGGGGSEPATVWREGEREGRERERRERERGKPINRERDRETETK